MVSNGFVKLGIKKGDVVLIIAPNSAQFGICFLGIVAIGVMATTVNPSYTTTEISKQIKDSKPNLIVNVDQFCLSGSEFTEFSKVVELSGSVSAGFRFSHVKQTDIAALLYSSGTTGASKGVVLIEISLLHLNFVAQIQSHGRSDHNCNRQMHSVYLCIVPIFHIAICVIQYSQLKRRNMLISMGKFDLHMVLRSVEKYLYVVPPIILAFSKQSFVLGSGTTPLEKDIMEECATNLPHVPIIQ
ncbi:hypothetical protein MKW98_029377, partial [Papaver atlanticum]